MSPGCPGPSSTADVGPVRDRHRRKPALARAPASNAAAPRRALTNGFPHGKGPDDLEGRLGQDLTAHCRQPHETRPGLDVVGHRPFGGDAPIVAGADVIAERGPAEEELERACREPGVDDRRDAQPGPAPALSGIHPDARRIACRQATAGVGDGDGDGGGAAVGLAGRVEDVVAQAVPELVLTDEPLLGRVDDRLLGAHLGCPVAWLARDQQTARVGVGVIGIAVVPGDLDPDGGVGDGVGHVVDSSGWLVGHRQPGPRPAAASRGSRRAGPTGSLWGRCRPGRSGR